MTNPTMPSKTKGPPPLVRLRGADGRHDSEDAVDERVRAEKNADDDERDAGPQEGQNSEDHGGNAADQQRPPVASENVNQSLLLRLEAL